MLLESFIGKHTCRADFREVAAEFVFKNTVFVAPEVYIVLRCESIQVVSTRVILIESDATITLDTSIHFMIDEWSQVLIAVTSFAERKVPVVMTAHDSHIL